MKFDELDARMRVFETAHDHCVLPGIHVVARIDGRSFTRLTKEVHRFEAPFDVRFRDLMLATTESLVAEFRALYGYTQSDEISLLFPGGFDLFHRKLRKLDSVLAGHASAVFSLGLGAVGTFDCRISQLPTRKDVVDYFRWRSEDAHRNALNGHCYWLLRRKKKSAKEATAALDNLSIPAKNEMLFKDGINFNDLPLWQRRGCGILWEEYEKVGRDPRHDREAVAKRRRTKRETELPMRDAYSAFIDALLEEAEAPPEGRGRASKG